MSLCQIQGQSIVVTNIYNINVFVAGLSVEYFSFQVVRDFIPYGILVSVNQHICEYIIKYILLHINLRNYKIFFPINILERLLLK